MRKIKLIINEAFPVYTNFSIVDVTDEKEKKRGGLTADYSKADIRPALDAGMDLEQTVAEYDEWLNKTLRRYMLDDCEIVAGREELLKIIKDNIKQHFD